MIVPTGKLTGGVAGAGDPVLRQFPPGGGIDRIADLLGTGGGGLDVELRLPPRPLDQVFHDVLRHGAAADVAVADE